MKYNKWKHTDVFMQQLVQMMSWHLSQQVFFYQEVDIHPVLGLWLGTVLFLKTRDVKLL
jgi:hypothetical protein